MAQNASVGRIVHYSYRAEDLSEQYQFQVGSVRPAIVVRDWGGFANLQVFTDGGNDGPDKMGGFFWATSISPSDTPEPGKYHWPVYVPSK